MRILNKATVRAHGAIDQGLHLRDLVGGGEPVGGPHHFAPHGIVSDERRDIDPEPELA